VHINSKLDWTPPPGKARAASGHPGCTGRCSGPRWSEYPRLNSTRLRLADANWLSKPIHKAGNIVGVELDSLELVSEKEDVIQVKDNASHLPHGVLVGHRSSFMRRLILPQEIISFCDHQATQRHLIYYFTT